jgi:hypothetical protein
MSDPRSPRAQSLAKPAFQLIGKAITALGKVAQNRLAVPVERTQGSRDARGATIAGTQVHSIRLPGIVLAF